MQKKEVIVIGAGPYGLSTAAHLQNSGVPAYVIGEALSFWKQHMPKKMLLRSRTEASNIHSPQEHHSIEAYQRFIGRKIAEPVPVEDFIAYGEWLQKQVAPNLDTRKVRKVSPNGSGFVVAMEDGESFHAKSVVLTLGIGLFSQRPEQFAGISREVAPHTSDLRDLTQFRGKRVAVLGKGQSALEYAALLHENGSEVQVITRAPALIFRPFAWKKHIFRVLTSGPLLPLSYRIIPPTDLGDVRTARKMADPEKFRKQTSEMQEKLIGACTRPIGAYWLEPRLKGVTIKTQLSVTGAEQLGAKLKLDFSDGTTDQVDAVVLATGYKIDISKYDMLDRGLLQGIQQTADGYPVLTTGLQTTVQGLYMAGVVAEKTLGPTLRFVTGTSNAGPRVAAAILGTAARR
jgi:FAD-dependent urate hydroxylase